MLTDAKNPDAFAQALTQHQARIYAFVFAQVAEAHLAHDVFQETNRVLWENAAEFDTSRAFLPWAFAIARNQVRAARQRRRRDRLYFDDVTVDRIAERVATRSTRLDDRQVALAECIERLPVGQRRLVECRYTQGDSIEAIANARQRSPSAIAVALFRVRKALASCIRTALGEDR